MYKPTSISDTWTPHQFAPIYIRKSTAISDIPHLHTPISFYESIKRALLCRTRIYAYTLGVGNVALQMARGTRATRRASLPSKTFEIHKKRGSFRRSCQVSSQTIALHHIRFDTESQRNVTECNTSRLSRVGGGGFVSARRNARAPKIVNTAKATARDHGQADQLESSDC